MKLGPLITCRIHETLQKARKEGAERVSCSLDLSLSTTTVDLDADGWRADGVTYPYLAICKERTIYHWVVPTFAPVSRFAGSLVKLVPTDWGPPTFEIDGIKMLPTAQISPYADAQRKVGLIQPRGKVILDTCGGLGYFAVWCLRGRAQHVYSFEINPDVLWLRGLNPWSPDHLPTPPTPPTPGHMTLTHGDICDQIRLQPRESFDAILHDPPRISIAGELYSLLFYEQLARVLKRNGRLFHYTGSPHKLTSGRDVQGEVKTRLRRAGFKAETNGDGVLAVKT